MRMHAATLAIAATWFRSAAKIWNRIVELNSNTFTHCDVSHGISRDYWCLAPTVVELDK
jgi:hypothetical protein